MSKKPISTFAQRLKGLRERAGLTQQQLATAAGLSVSLITQMEQGLKKDPRLSTLEALMNALRVGVEELISGEAAAVPVDPRATKAPPAVPPAAELEATAKERMGKRKTEGPPAKKHKER